MTLRLKSHISHDIEKAAKLLLEGELVAFATETVYGLGALGMDEGAIAKIYAAKGRPSSNPLIFHVSDIDAAYKLWQLNEVQQEQVRLLAKRFWPGPLSIVAPKAPHVPANACAGLPTVAVRIPAHKVALALLRAAGVPIVAPSANASNRPSPSRAEHVLTTLDGKIAAVLDDGPCRYGLESTIVDLSGKIPAILRLGAISSQALTAVLPQISLQTHAPTKNPLAPGQFLKHYAPLVDLIEVAVPQKLSDKWLSDAAILLRHQSHQKLESTLGKRPNGAITHVLSDDAVCFASELYAAFYSIESQKPHTLLLEDCSDGIEKDNLWLALLDRITRAAHAPLE